MKSQRSRFVQLGVACMMAASVMVGCGGETQAAAQPNNPTRPAHCDEQSNILDSLRSALDSSCHETKK